MNFVESGASRRLDRLVFERLERDEDRGVSVLRDYHALAAVRLGLFNPVCTSIVYVFFVRRPRAGRSLQQRFRLTCDTEVL